MSKIYSRNCDHCGQYYIGYGKHFCSNKCANQVDAIKQFWSYVNITDLISCWEWHGLKTDFGHGRLCVDYKIVRAHRFAWELYYGKIPDGLQINHKCNNPPCVNIAHLYLGTQQDNMDDMVKANRSLNGEQNPIAKLTDAQVLEILELLKTNMTHKEIAKRFSVTRPNITSINRGKTWRHLSCPAN